GSAIQTGANVLIHLNATGGTQTVQYNYLKNAWSDFIQASTTIDRVDIRFNLFENAGVGTAAAHADWFQTPGGGRFRSITWDYNTAGQNPQGPKGLVGVQGVGLGNQLNPEFRQASFSNNVVLATGTANVSYFFTVAKGSLNGTAVANDNYFDPSKVFKIFA